MQTTCAVLTPRAVWCRARAPAGLAKLSQLLALSPWHLIAHGRSESSSKEQISARAFISGIRAAYRPLGWALLARHSWCAGWWVRGALAGG